MFTSEGSFVNRQGDFLNGTLFLRRESEEQRAGDHDLGPTALIRPGAGTAGSGWSKSWHRKNPDSLAHRNLDRDGVGLSNTTDFLRAHRDGRLEVRAVPVHQGRTGQLWQCDITREDGKLVAQGRVRLQNVPKP